MRSLFHCIWRSTEQHRGILCAQPFLLQQDVCRAILLGHPFELQRNHIEQMIRQDLAFRCGSRIDMDVVMFRYIV
jgi:hypothetical protein